jgi:hypothetical protein
MAHIRRPLAATLNAAIFLGAVASVLGCSGELLGVREPPGSLPEIAGGLAIAVLPFANETGSSLRVPPPRFVRDAPGALIDPYDAESQAALLLLQQRAAAELARRGYAVVPPEQVAAVLPEPPKDVLAAARAARLAGFEGPVLTGTLRRFHVTETGLLQVWLDLALVDPATQRVLWSGSARRPVEVAPAQTWQEIVLDAGGPIFADAFGKPLMPAPASAR